MLRPSPVLAAAQPVTVSASVSSSRLAPGESAEVAIEFEIADGWHINSNEPGLEFLIPTTLTFEVPAGLVAENLRFPPAVVRSLQLGGGRELRLYEGTVRVAATLRHATAANGGEAVAVVRYQACNDELCLRPQTVRLPLALDLSARLWPPVSRRVAYWLRRPFTPAGFTLPVEFPSNACSRSGFA
jgi:DsbC/DsbD-like thiol-disulfide interchange protein